MKTLHYLPPLQPLFHYFVLKVFLISALFSILSCTAGAPPSAYKEYARAIQLYMNGQNKEALKCFEKLHRAYPRFTEASIFYGRVLFYSGRYDEAVLCLEEIIEDSLCIDSMKILSRSYLRLGKTEKAAQVLALAMTYSSEDPELLYLSACCHIASDNQEEALTLLKAACTLMERQIEIPLELAALYSRYGLFSEAEKLLGQYLNILEEEHPLRKSIEKLNSDFQKKMACP